MMREESSVTAGSLGDRWYHGDGRSHYPPLEHKQTPQTAEPYIASPSLRDAVNVALALRRPLLLEGEPGTGKTRLARAVAYELGFPLIEVYVRSTSRAQELLWTYDAVRRLYDIQGETWSVLTGAKAVGKAPGAARTGRRGDGAAPQDEHPYVKLGKLGEAIELAEQQTPSVVLIDEIDKADPDFPNDLLQVIEDLRFEITDVPGLEWEIDALKGRSRDDCREILPLFIITSNREKELPPPFLRRCLFYFIEFPNEQELEGIVREHFRTKELTELLKEAIRKFRQLRGTVAFKWRKPPSTSELIDWIRVLLEDERTGRLTAAYLTRTPLVKLPHQEVLLKTHADQEGLQSERGPGQGPSEAAETPG